MGLHATTVRFHLDALCAEGVVERTRIARAGVGRPRTGYLAVPERLDYRSLAEILALELGDTTDERRRRAESAGRRWAGQIVAGLAGKESAGQRETLIATVFSRTGFSPEVTVTSTGTPRTIRLRTCPIRDLARAHPEVGCALHRGLLQGLLAHPTAGNGRSAGPPMRGELEPFVEPELCLVRIGAHD